MMNYRQIAPSAAVARFVECYWLLEDDSLSSAEIQRIVPDGRSELILNLSHPYESFQKQGWQTQPERFFVGQITGPMMVRPRAQAKILGIRFRPDGAGHLLRLPMHELTDIAAPLDELSTRLDCQLVRLRELNSLAQHLNYVDHTLQKLAEQNGRKDLSVTAAINQIIKARGVIDTADVASYLGISLRQLQRRFKTEVGIGPKLFSRIQRFQNVFQGFDNHAHNWVHVALKCGYYDQAHLIRDFQDFSGQPPAALFTPDTDLAVHFLQKR